MRERGEPRGLPDLCAYPLERAEAILRRVAPTARVRIVQTGPPRVAAPSGPLRVLRQRVLDDGVVELLVAAEDGHGPSW